MFKNRYEIEINESNIMITHANSKEKTSFHIVIHKLIDNKTLVYETNRKK